MPDQQHQREVTKVSKSGPTDIPDIVEVYIASVMRDRKNMQLMEHELDSYLAKFTKEQKQGMREEVRKQLTDGRLALESMLQRFLSS
jgi:hypothetical protein